MDLSPYVDNLHAELLAAAESGEADALARRLAAAVASATRLTMLEVLSAAADEITRDLVPGSVQVRLRGRDPYFEVTPPADLTDLDTDPPPAEPEPEPAGREGAVSRINFRPPEQLKQRIEAAAAEEGLSVNAWLVRATTAALDGGRKRGRRGTGEFTGWVG